jgi:hypothetical protein
MELKDLAAWMVRGVDGGNPVRRWKAVGEYRIYGPVIGRYRTSSKDLGAKMAKYFLYLFFIFVFILVLEFFKIVDIPYLEIPDWVSETESLYHQDLDEADKIK